MMSPADHDRLLAHAKQLIGIQSGPSALSLTSQEIAALTGAPLVYAISRDRASRRGTELVFAPDGLRDPEPGERSALFALERRLASGSDLLFLERPAERSAIFDALAPEARALVAVPLVTRRGRLGGLFAFGVDTLERRPGLERALLELSSLAGAAIDSANRYAFARRDQERLQLLAEASEETLWDWLPGSGEVWWGGKFHDLLGRVGVGEENRLSWKFDRIHPEDVERVRRSFASALESNASTWREEYRLQWADRSSIAVEDGAYILRETDGRAYRVVGSLRNITALKSLLAREQAAREDAERANRAKDEFLAMLGHELRNPLAPMLTALHLLKLKGSPAIERERTVLERQARHLTRLVDDLLDVSRIIEGKVRLQSERVELSEIVASAIELASPLIEQRRQQLHVAVPETLVVDADRARLAQVLANLLNNASKYTDERGHIRLSARRSAEDVEIEITDDGIGIDPAILPRIFGLFVQERQSLARSQGGLGLGLAIARSLVELHGGTIRAQSEGRGRGTTLTVTLPLAARPAAPLAAVAPVQPSPARGGGPSARKILVVDDNRDAAEGLADILAELGHVTRLAHDGPEALAAATEFAPDIVLLDIGLPVMDGYEVARTLRQRPSERPLRLIAITGYGQERDKELAKMAGFDAHLVKPVALNLLMRAMS